MSRGESGPRWRVLVKRRRKAKRVQFRVHEYRAGRVDVSLDRTFAPKKVGRPAGETGKAWAKRTRHSDVVSSLDRVFGHVPERGWYEVYGVSGAWTLNCLACESAAGRSGRTKTDEYRRLIVESHGDGRYGIGKGGYIGRLR